MPRADPPFEGISTSRMRNARWEPGFPWSPFPWRAKSVASQRGYGIFRDGLRSGWLHPEWGDAPSLSERRLPVATGIAYSHTGRNALEPRAVPVNDTTYRLVPVQTRAVDLVLQWEQGAEGRYKLALPEGTRLRGPAGGWLYRWDRVQG